MLAAAALHGGAEPDLLDEVAWWQADDFWQYALYAAIAYIRAAADRAGVPGTQACQELTRRPARRPADPLVHDLQFRQQKDPIGAVAGSADPGHTADQNGGNADMPLHSDRPRW